MQSTDSFFHASKLQKNHFTIWQTMLQSNWNQPTDKGFFQGFPLLFPLSSDRVMGGRIPLLTILMEVFLMKIGILGTGDISHAFMNALPSYPHVEVTSVYHREVKKAFAFAEQYIIPQAFGNLVELLDSGVDCVYIGLPNSLHYEAAMQCMKAGKHVLIEKPVTSNLAELQRLLQFARQQNVYALEVNRVAFLENYQFIQETLPKLGSRTLMQLSYYKRSRRYSDYLAGKHPNVFSTDFSGGALYDLGVYGLHFVCGLLGAPDSLEYRCLKLESGVDGMGSATLAYPTCIATIHTSKISGGSATGVHIQGENGTLSSAFPPSVLDTVTFSQPNAEAQFHLQTQDGFSAFLQNALRIILENDTCAYEQLSQQSLLVAELMQKARTQQGIVFSADRSTEEAENQQFYAPIHNNF